MFGHSAVTKDQEARALGRSLRGRDKNDKGFTQQMAADNRTAAGANAAMIRAMIGGNVPAAAKPLKAAEPPQVKGSPGAHILLRSSAPPTPPPAPMLQQPMTRPLSPKRPLNESTDSRERKKQKVAPEEAEKSSVEAKPAEAKPAKKLFKIGDYVHVTPHEQFGWVQHAICRIAGKTAQVKHYDDKVFTNEGGEMVYLDIIGGEKMVRVNQNDLTACAGPDAVYAKPQSPELSAQEKEFREFEKEWCVQIATEIDVKHYEHWMNKMPNLGTTMWGTLQAVMGSGFAFMYYKDILPAMEKAGYNCPSGKTPHNSIVSNLNYLWRNDLIERNPLVKGYYRIADYRGEPIHMRFDNKVVMHRVHKAIAARSQKLRDIQASEESDAMNLDE